MKAIILNLTNLSRMHMSLLDIATQKTAALVSNSVQELDALLKKEQQHIAAIEQLEKQRQQMVTDYLKAKGIASAVEPTVSALLKVANDAERQQLEQIRQSLMTTIDELKSKNNDNQKLIYQSLQFVNMTLDLVRPQAPATATMNYSNKEVRRPMNTGGTTYEV